MIKMQICIFEDKGYENLYPLTLLRPVFELKCGHSALLDKILRRYKGVKVHFFVRDCLVPILKKKTGGNCVNDLVALKDDVLFLNGRWLSINSSIELNGPEEIGLCNNDVVYARLKRETVISYATSSLERLLEAVKSKIQMKPVSATLISYPWELIKYNGKAIEEDFKSLGKSGIEGKMSPHAAIVGDRDKVFIAQGAQVQPFVTLDTTSGPILIDKEAVVHPYSRIKGPASIGAETEIFEGNIREGTTIGPMCRVGGEVEESIIHGYSNKYHEGFLGHSYVCEWVNLGALTTTSDLKNDYSQVRVYIKGELRDSHESKVGCFIGDHTKTSIGAFFNTGSVVGVMTNVVHSGGLLPKFIPAFCWFFNNRVFKGYGFRNMLETARSVMARRNRDLSEDEIELLKSAYEITKEERDFWIKKGKIGL